MAASDAPQLAGTSVRDIRWAIENVVGREVVERALASVPEKLRTEYANAVPLKWVDYDVIRVVHEAIAFEAGQPIEDILKRAVPMAVERSFGTVWRTLLRLTGDEALIARTPLLYSRSRSKGRMQARLVSPGSGVAELTEWVGVPDRDLLSLALGIETIMRIAGRKDVEVTFERTEQGGRFSIRFRPS